MAGVLWPTLAGVFIGRGHGARGPRVRRHFLLGSHHRELWEPAGKMILDAMGDPLLILFLKNKEMGVDIGSLPPSLSHEKQEK